MNTEKTKVSPLYLQLIEGMHRDKLKINDAKLARHGSSISMTTDLLIFRNLLLSRKPARTVWYTVVHVSGEISDVS